MYTIVRTGPKVELTQKSRALLYSDLVRQTNRHASNKPSCVKRTVMRQANRHASTVMRQPSEYEINSTVSLFLLFGPSCVNRHASKYESALTRITKKCYITAKNALAEKAYTCRITPQGTHWRYIYPPLKTTPIYFFGALSTSPGCKECYCTRKACFVSLICQSMSSKLRKHRVGHPPNLSEFAACKYDEPMV